MLIRILHEEANVMNLLDIYGSMGKQLNISEVLKTNQESEKHGLILTATQAQEIVEARNLAIQSHGRLELGIEAAQKIIAAFCTSPYISREEYVLTINELIDIFYHVKNETEDLIGDDEMISTMKEFYNNSCQGSLELLKDREMTQFAIDFRSSLLQMDNGWKEE